MSRERFCRQCGQWHSTSDWPRECIPRAPERSGMPAPMVLSDTIDPTQSMANGQYYTSKSALRRHYKDDGYIEVGNDYPREYPKPPKPDRQKIKASVEKAISKAGLGAV